MQKLINTAIQRIKTYDPIANGFADEPYYLAYSGGKDSDAVRILFALAGVKHDLVHSLSTVDAPETIRYINTIDGVRIDRPEITMWNLIPRKRVPPTRLMRYCCEYYKEAGGKGRFVATGVRWAEGTNRKKNRGSIEIANTRNRVVLNADNSADRRLFEACRMKGKRILNPIVDWSESDVWMFLREYSCQSNPLYWQGFSRVGCIGCPMSGVKGREKEFKRWPTYKTAYIHAFERMLAKRAADGLTTERWETGQDVFDWWMSN